MAKNYTLAHSSCAQWNGKTVIPGEFPTLSHRARQNQAVSIELSQGQYHNWPAAALLPPLNRLQIDVKHIAPVRDVAIQRASFPAGPPLNHSRSDDFTEKSDGRVRAKSCAKVYFGFFCGSTTKRPLSTATLTRDPA
jgi:hypothetical protein